MENKMNIIANALVCARQFKNVRLNGDLIGPTNALIWKNAVTACLHAAYDVASRTYNGIATNDESTIDKSNLFDAVHDVIILIGEINGMKLNSVRVADIMTGYAMGKRVIDTTPEMAHARCALKSARDSFKINPTAENGDKVDAMTAEVKRLESIAGNCKKIPYMASYGSFAAAVEMALGDAINGQSAMTADQIQAEKDAAKAARAEKRRKNKAEKANNK